MNDTISLYYKEVWGQGLLYVFDDTTREALRLLTNRKTVSLTDVRALRRLGFNISIRFHDKTLIFDGVENHFQELRERLAY